MNLRAFGLFTRRLLWIAAVCSAAPMTGLSQLPDPRQAASAADSDGPADWISTRVLRVAPTGQHGDYPVQAAGYLREAPVTDAAEPPQTWTSFPLHRLRQQIRRSEPPTSSGSIYGRGMTVEFDESGDKYIRFLTWNQVWTAFTDNNPGTVDAYDELQDSSLDIGLRRTRFVAYSQLTDRYLILLHVGINNQTFTNGGGSGASGIGPTGVGKKPQIFVHEAWNEYVVLPQSESRDMSLTLGAGLHYWNGVSRKSSASTLSFMTADAPIFNWPNIEFTDQFARQFGWYAKGKYKQLDYRVSVNHPFNADDRAALNRERAVNIAANSLAYAGYFEWEFWDEEPNVLPYKTSSWLGEKRVFNIGAGYYFQPDASGILDADDRLRKQNHLAVGIDCYLDKPIGQAGAALTCYGVYYIFDYGDNYFRNVAIMSTGRLGSPGLLAAEGIEPTISGPGNAQPLMGTGEILYLEAGYVLPTWVLGESHGKLQPFGAFTHKNLAWLDDPAFNWDVGMNYLIDGHRAKVTFQYSWRPQFFERAEAGAVHRVADGFGGEFIIQAQVAL
jgi:hypothetical protein